MFQTEEHTDIIWGAHQSAHIGRYVIENSADLCQKESQTEEHKDINWRKHQPAYIRRYAVENNAYVPVFLCQKESQTEGHKDIILGGRINWPISDDVRLKTVLMFLCQKINSVSGWSVIKE